MIQRKFLPLIPLALFSMAPASQAASTVISSQNPTNYWTLDETVNPLADTGSGTSSAGTLVGANGNGASLLANASGTGVDFAGGSQEVTIVNSSTINDGVFANKTLSMAFNAGTIDSNRRLIWEQGGTTRGINFYVESIAGTPTLILNMWNRAESNWGPSSVSVPISVGVTYHAAFVLEGNPDGDDNTDDGTVIGYLNGVEIGSDGGAGVLRGHTDPIALGGNTGNTIFADGTSGPGTNFIGTIDEVAQWNSVLTPGQISAQAAEFVPEPGTSLLSGLAALFLLRRRRVK